MPPEPCFVTKSHRSIAPPWFVPRQIRPVSTAPRLWGVWTVLCAETQPSLPDQSPAGPAGAYVTNRKARPGLRLFKKDPGDD